MMIDECEIPFDWVPFELRYNPACRWCHKLNHHVSASPPLNVPNTQQHCLRCTKACHFELTSWESPTVPENVILFKSFMKKKKKKINALLFLYYYVVVTAIVLLFSPLHLCTFNIVWRRRGKMKNWKKKELKKYRSCIIKHKWQISLQHPNVY